VLVDANLILWAHHRSFPHHEAARSWWSSTLSDVPAVAIPWPTILAFLRISTHPRALERPLDVLTAWGVVEGWLVRPNVLTPAATARHAPILARMLRDGRASGNHCPDAHLAALAVEWGFVLVSADRDFARYPEIRWHDPTAAW
jgi:toxin-antitoxin system PIN domain toxin